MNTDNDTRYCYSATCTWNGPIQETKPVNGIPGCPHCGSPLYEVATPKVWWDSVDKYAREKPDPEYMNFMWWLRQISKTECTPLRPDGYQRMRERSNPRRG